MTAVSKSFKSKKVLDGVSLTVHRGEKLVLIGASGSGKTTLLRCLIGLTEVDAGRIEIDGEPIVDRLPDGVKVDRHAAEQILRDKVGMVFQSFNLFPHRTALENVIEAPVHVRKLPRDQAIDKARVLLDRVGILEHQDQYPSQLSGGQQQRVAIARALAMDPEIILFDEITSALDPELTGEVLEVMSDLAASGQTMLSVSHEMGFVREVADRVVFMDKGVIVEEGEPGALLEAPKAERTKQFLSKVLHVPRIDKAQR
ncbi:MAG TPA: amino acid ABC transporter ATP-binding protein [Actinomycetes bacterium]|nr:amino acid ABC transporter ATP-binding protein [Actinomycetes bacterium]